MQDSFFCNKKERPVAEKDAPLGIALRWKGRWRCCDPPQAKNPAMQDSFLQIP